jgi:hypothetical protein
MGIWKNLSPYSLVEPDNPVFQQEQRRLRWLKTPESLLKYNLIVWIGIPALILLWWLIERIGLGFKYVQPDLENRILIAVLVISLSVMVLSSFYIVITTIGRIHRQFHAGDWQTLRMTNQSESDILGAKDAIAQIHAWPFLALEIGLRGAFVSIFTLNNFYDLYHSYADKSLYIQTTVLNLVCWGGWGLILTIGLAFVFESWLRMRVLIAWSMAIALQVKQASLALLTGFAAALLFHFTQATLIVSLAAILTKIRDSNDEAGIALACLFILLCAFAAALFYAFYISIRRMSNNFIRRKAFAQD